MLSDATWRRALALAARLPRRALQAVPVAIGIIALDFLLLQLLPGDAADVLAGESGSATAESMAAIRVRFGLDQPLLAQFMNYLDHLLHFDLGISPRYNLPVWQMIQERLPNTLLLMLCALGFALAAGLLLGAVMASFAGRWPDRLVTLLVLALYSMPGFWVGLMAVILFSVRLGWLPAQGDASIGLDLHGLDWLLDRASHLVLPALALGSFFVAIYARLTRAAMLEVQRQDFVRTALAKGLHPIRVQLGHVLRNALIPVTTMAGLHLGNMLGGAVVVETVFGWPGMGRLALDAVLARDYTVLLGVLLLSSFAVILLNLVIDLLHVWLDPRIAGR